MDAQKHLQLNVNCVILIHILSSNVNKQILSTILIHSDAPAKGYLILVKHRLVYQLMPSHFNACFVMPIYVAKQIKQEIHSKIQSLDFEVFVLTFSKNQHIYLNLYNFIIYRHFIYDIINMHHIDYNQTEYTNKE